MSIKNIIAILLIFSLNNLSAQSLSLFQNCGSNINILDSNLIESEDFVQLALPEVEAGVHCHDTLYIPVYIGGHAGRFTTSIQGTLRLESPLDLISMEGKPDFSSFVLPHAPYYIIQTFDNQNYAKQNTQGREQVLCLEVPSPKKLGIYKLEMLSDSDSTVSAGLVPAEVTTGVSDGESQVPHDLQQHFNDLIVTSGHIHVKEMNCNFIGN